MPSDHKALMEALAAEFDLKDIKYFPASLSRDKKSGKVAPYADARTYMERLDAVVGPLGWATKYRLLDDLNKAVECQLTLIIDGQPVTKAGIGYPNEARDAADAAKEPLKAAYSDAFKLACVAWGVGRFLYRLEFKRDWLPLDDFKKFTEAPVLKDGRALGGGAAEPPRQQQGQGQRSVPQQRQQNQRPQAPAAGKPHPSQLGDYVAPNGTIHMTKFSEAMLKAGITKAEIVAVTGETPKGGWMINEWLVAHPEKNLDDLILAASEIREAA